MTCVPSYQLSFSVIGVDKSRITLGEEVVVTYKIRDNIGGNNVKLEFLDNGKVVETKTVYLPEDADIYGFWHYTPETDGAHTLCVRVAELWNNWCTTKVYFGSEYKGCASIYVEENFAISVYSLEPEKDTFTTDENVKVTITLKNYGSNADGYIVLSVDDQEYKKEKIYMPAGATKTFTYEIGPLPKGQHKVCVDITND